MAKLWTISNSLCVAHILKRWVRLFLGPVRRFLLLLFATFPEAVLKPFTPLSEELLRVTVMPIAPLPRIAKPLFTFSFPAALDLRVRCGRLGLPPRHH